MLFMRRIIYFLYFCTYTIITIMEDLNTYMSDTDYSEARSFFIERGKKQVFRRKEYYVRQNAVSLYVSYVQEGIFHYVCTGDDGKEHVVGYSFEDEFVCDYSSFIRRGNSLVGIRALTDCVVFSVSLDDYLEFTNTAQNGLHFGFRVANGLFEMCYKRLLTFYCDTPEVRYMNLMKQCPSLKDKVSLKEIASFLGVTPETVSHIRKKLLDK